MEKEWTAALVERPRLVRPVRVDPIGEAGPTRGQVRGRAWRRTNHGYWIPSATDSTIVEQRILEESMRLGPAGVVTGWAALRLAGAAYFDGTAAGRVLPVPLISPDRQLRTSVGAVAVRAELGDGQRTTRLGVPVAVTERAVVDELLRLVPDLEAAIVAIDMVCAARLTSLLRIRRQLAVSPPRRHHRFLMAALDGASEWSRSPRETWMRRVWRRQPGFGEPWCNRPIWAKGGDLLGVPDLFDEEAGVVGEYDGAAHRSRARHRRDEVRRAAFAAHGIETFVLVAGDSEEVAIERMHAARQRALWRSEPDRTWTMDRPPGAWVPRDQLSLDHELDGRPPPGRF